MIILALDTALGACSAALWSEGRSLAHRFELMSKGQAERLMPQAVEVMGEAGLEMAALDRLACTIGPGSFTGTRIALSAARGMALALKIPLIGVTTLEAVAAGLEPGPDKVRAAVFDARRGEVYLQIFEGETLVPVTKPEVLGLEAAAERAKHAAKGLSVEIAGTGATLLVDALAEIETAAHCPVTSANGSDSADYSGAEGHPDARLVARIAATRKAPAAPPSPLYLRAPDAKLPVPK